MKIRRLHDCEEIIANDGCRLRELWHPGTDESAIPYSLAVAWVDPGERTLPHQLRGHTEVYLIVSGEGRMHVGEEAERVGPGDSVVVPPDTKQWIENVGTGSLHFAVMVDPPWQAETDVRVDA